MKEAIGRLKFVLKKYLKFIGPGLMVSVAYMDPGNYSTAVTAGAAFKYNLLFLILLSNCFAVFLQVLAAKLGAVTGLDLAQNCRANLPSKVNLAVYVLAEIAIIATDIAEVVGTAIALNILFGLPLVMGVIVTVLDVLIVLMAYRPKGPLVFIRVFEWFVSVLVAATVICFSIELYQVSHDKSVDFSVLEVMKGFLPNEKVIDRTEHAGGSGLFLSLAILGATVMPHSLYLGSGLVQARLRDYDIKHGNFIPPNLSNNYSQVEQLEGQDALDANLPNNVDPLNTKYSDQYEDEEEHYRPSIHAINDTMTYTLVELVISLFTVALFVNAAILIVAGATLNNGQKIDRYDDHHESDSDTDDEEAIENAGLFTIYKLLSHHLSTTAGFVFALALLFSGQSAGVVCTLAGQMVLEGFLKWSFPPVIRRLITRGLAIFPCLFVVVATGREGLTNVLNLSQVILSILLPIVSAPLIWFTCSKRIMSVPLFEKEGDEDLHRSEVSSSGTTIDISNSQSDTENQLERGLQKSFSPYPSDLGKDHLKIQTREPAIRLNALRKAHPCGGWEDDDTEVGQVLLHCNTGETAEASDNNPTKYNRQEDIGTSFLSDSERNTMMDEVNDVYRVQGYKDMSNNNVTSFFAFLVWGFITALNIYLIWSVILGDDIQI